MCLRAASRLLFVCRFGRGYFSTLLEEFASSFLFFVCVRVPDRETREKNPRYSDTLTVQFFLDRNEFKARGEFASSLLA